MDVVAESYTYFHRAKIDKISEKGGNEPHFFAKKDRKMHNVCHFDNSTARKRGVLEFGTLFADLRATHLSPAPSEGKGAGKVGTEVLTLNY